MLYWIGHLWLRLAGWRLESVPRPPRFVMIAAPHTSNWDTVHMLAMGLALRMPITFLAKDTLFWPPLGWVLRWFGGVAIDKTAAHGVVGQAIGRFEGREQLVLAIAPEGTRRKAQYWRSGFYRIAHGAGVPIGLGYLDYGRNVGGIGGYFTPTGDLHADMDHLRAFYKDIRGRVPSKETVPRLREEDEAADGDGAAPGSQRSPPSPRLTGP